MIALKTDGAVFQLESPAWEAIIDAVPFAITVAEVSVTKRTPSPDVEVAVSEKEFPIKKGGCGG